MGIGSRMLRVVFITKIFLMSFKYMLLLLLPPRAASAAVIMKQQQISGQVPKVHLAGVF